MEKKPTKYSQFLGQQKTSYLVNKTVQYKNLIAINDFRFFRQ